jgi:hypothetical protein
MKLPHTTALAPFPCHSEVSGSDAEESRERLRIDGCFQHPSAHDRPAVSLTVRVDGATCFGGATRSFECAAGFSQDDTGKAMK